MADVGPVGENPLRDEVDALVAQVADTTREQLIDEVRQETADREPQQPAGNFYGGFNSFDQLDAETKQRVEQERRRQEI